MIQLNYIGNKIPGSESAMEKNMELENSWVEGNDIYFLNFEVRKTFGEKNFEERHLNMQTSGKEPAR